MNFRVVVISGIITTISCRDVVAPANIVAIVIGCNRWLLLSRLLGCWAVFRVVHVLSVLGYSMPMSINLLPSNIQKIIANTRTKSYGKISNDNRVERHDNEGDTPATKRTCKGSRDEG